MSNSTKTAHEINQKFLKLNYHPRYIFHYGTSASSGLKETHNSSKILSLDFGKNDSSTPKNVL